MAGALKYNEDRFNLDRIDKFAKKLRGTEMGRPLIEFGLLQEVDVVLRSGMDTAGYYSEGLLGNPEIALNADCDDALLTMALAHELRHVEQMLVQQKRPFEYAPLDAVRLTRVLEADASAYTAGVAYEIFQTTGDKSYLDALDDIKEHDIRKAFIKAATPGMPVREDMVPFRAAFDQWFKKKSRVAHYDRAAIEQYRGVKDSFLSLVFNSKSAPLTVKALKEIGAVGKTNYLDEAGIKNKLFSADFYAGNISGSVSRLASKL